MALFLGNDEPELISTRDFPEDKANCIYYADDCLLLPIGAPYQPFGAIVMGVFDLESKHAEPFNLAGPGVLGLMPPPIWVLPEGKDLKCQYFLITS
ncbi:hypothetical protein CDL15_Pgr016901 [Punica granatum]|uniref:Uncharacterized protein n=1 Tax=Punica granatum TaxID=22663 RepID=A0A218WXY8_PUNGR|nr:hypothetical protein CDL15_Pgr016901 [Punica granatum]PKI69282.1 hypothetical protein CRG98_010283 [Punica granatum]